MITRYAIPARMPQARQREPRCFTDFEEIPVLLPDPKLKTPGKLFEIKCEFWMIDLPSIASPMVKTRSIAW
jgi:hypothetical protein